MKFDVIIQARMESERLPGKVLLKIKKKPILQYMIERIKKFNNINKIIIATTIKKKDDQIVKFCKYNNIYFYRGSEKNVLKRIYFSAKKFDSKNIVFLTGDCPIIDIKIVNKLTSIYSNGTYNYVGNSFIRSYPDGMDVQIFNFNTLKKMIKLAKGKLEKEHVTLSIKKNPKKFKIKNIIAKKKLFWPQLGLTLDQKEDFDLLKKLIVYFEKKKYFFECYDVINLLKTKKKNWASINHHIKRKGDT
tara:strand:+ start:1645 stop:2382 length:738 start_codon:yes stop_codon:yes gene_type:complete